MACTCLNQKQSPCEDDQRWLSGLHFFFFSAEELSVYIWGGESRIPAVHVNLELQGLPLVLPRDRTSSAASSSAVAAGGTAASRSPVLPPHPASRAGALEVRKSLSSAEKGKQEGSNTDIAGVCFAQTEGTPEPPEC